MSGIMSVKEVASYLRIRKQTAYRLVQQGKIPAVKIGGQWKVLSDHLDRMFDEMLNEKLRGLKD